MDNKDVFAKNLKYYMKEFCKTRRDISQALNISYYTVSDWVNGKKYPRMDKVEMLANYFGILKSDLIEEIAIEDKTSPNAPGLTDGETDLLEWFRTLSDEEQKIYLEMFRARLKARRKD
jgi:transcriptional regulator with XRE-family HTH domain